MKPLIASVWLKIHVEVPKEIYFDITPDFDGEMNFVQFNKYVENKISKAGIGMTVEVIDSVKVPEE